MPRFSGTLTPDHAWTDAAKSPNGFATVANAPAPKPPNVNSNIPSAKLANMLPRLSGTVTLDHLLTDSAKSPNGFATLAMASAPNPDRLFINPPKATSPKASCIADNPRLISSHDIEPNFCNASAISPNP